MPNRNAIRLRAAMTDAETRLWRALSNRQLGGLKFRRQHPVGPLGADFACVEKRLIIEADGGQHRDSANDDRRTKWLARRGWTVVRFWNNEILTNLEGVQEKTLSVAQDRRSQFRPSPSRLTAGPSLSHKWERVT